MTDTNKMNLDQIQALEIELRAKKVELEIRDPILYEEEIDFLKAEIQACREAAKKHLEKFIH